MLKLAPYQIDGANHIVSLFDKGQRGAYLADEPGVGKTPQAIRAADLLCAKSIVVLCPAGLKINWQREFEMWSGWGFRPEIITTSNAKEAPEFPDKIINYDILHRIDLGLLGCPDLLIVDESHYIKNDSSKRSLAALELCNRSKNILFMSGTPAENRPKELWFQLVCLGWAPLDSYPDYARKFCDRKIKTFWKRSKVGKPYKKLVYDDSGASNLPLLKNYLQRHGLLRRKKADVLKDLPPKREKIVELPRRDAITPLLMEAFKMAGVYTDEDKLRFLSSFEELAKTDDRYRRVHASVAEARRMEGTAKSQFVLPYVEDLLLAGRKVIVGCVHTAAYDAYMSAFKAYGAVGINGSVSSTARQAAVDRFQTDEQSRVFVGQLKASGVGITLTASDYVVFAEMDWVPATMTQFSDRAHRRGQQNCVNVDYLVTCGSTDALIAKALIEKTANLEQIFR